MYKTPTTTPTSGAHPGPPRRGRGGRLLRALGALAAVAILLGGGYVWLNGRIDAFTLLPTCRATALGNTTSLDPEQAGNAAIIAALAEKRSLPARAATIGIATAMQESKLRNIDYGDRDSLGLFQQRPSQGWGTREQILDPVYATNAFYDVLVKIEGYESLPITKAAQTVQRSAFPAAYADHEPEARIFASALAGHSEAALVCTLRSAGALAAEEPGENGMTARAQAVVSAAGTETGRTGVATTTDTAAPGTAATFVMSGQDAHRHAWALAQWAVARAHGLDIESVAVDGRRWSRGSDEWTADADAPPSGTVLVTVAAGE